MKKIITFGLSCLFLLTGCGAGATNTMKCTYKNSSNTLSTNITYTIDHEGDEIKKVRIMYYYEGLNNQNNEMTNNGTDGVGTGTDGTTSDTQLDNDGIIDGVVGSAIDSIVNSVTDIILDVSGLKDRHLTVQNTYGTIPGFSVENMTDIDNTYKVSYIIDYDTISDDDLNRLNLSRDINSLKSNYVNQGFTCEE